MKYVLPIDLTRTDTNMSLICVESIISFVKYVGIYFDIVLFMKYKHMYLHSEHENGRF